MTITRTENETLGIVLKSATAWGRIQQGKPGVWWVNGPNQAPGGPVQIAGIPCRRGLCWHHTEADATACLTNTLTAKEPQ